MVENNVEPDSTEHMSDCEGSSFELYGHALQQEKYIVFNPPISADHIGIGIHGAKEAKEDLGVAIASEKLPITKHCLCLMHSIY